MFGYGVIVLAGELYDAMGDCAMSDRETVCATESYVRPMEVNWGFSIWGLGEVWFCFRGYVWKLLRELGGYLGFGLISLWVSGVCVFAFLSFLSLSMPALFIAI